MIMLKLSRTVGAFLASLSLALIGLSSIPISANAQVDTVEEVERILNHFHCYQAQGESPPAIAFLQDQFDRLDGANNYDLAFVSNPALFCNPTEKMTADGAVTPIVNKFNHLTLHRMLTLPQGPTREVAINNQFGEQRLKVLDWSFLLGVPTEKNREGAPSEIDHFKCHFVTSGEPVDREVQLADQFFPNGLDTKVGRPLLLCNPTRKIHPPVGSVGVFEPDAHLACYALEPTPFQRDVRIDNQFVEAAPLVVGRSQALCVPSLKRLVVDP